MTQVADKLAPEDRFRERLTSFGDDPRRARLFEAFEKAGLPHRRMEGWRWSDLRAGLKGVDLSAAGAAPADAFVDVAGPVFRFDDQGLTAPAKRPAGIQWFEDTNVVPFGGAEDQPMGALAAALSGSPATLTIEISGDQPAPVRLVFEGAGERFQRVSVILREGASVEIIESHLSGGGFSSVALEFLVEDKASLSRSIYQASSPDAVQVVTARANLHAGAAFNQSGLAQGAKLFRCETRLVHDRGTSEANLDAAYILESGRHCDVTSHVTHAVAECTTGQVVKGAVKNGGKGAFQGKFLVKKGAQQTDAEMQHQALLLEDGAEVNAKPELEIYADDVQCAHGNTCGGLDANALFYMRQRGIPQAQARAMLTESFIAEAFANASENVREILTEEARRWLTADL